MFDGVVLIKHTSHAQCFRLLRSYVMLLGFLPYFLLIVHGWLSSSLGWASGRIE